MEKQAEATVTFMGRLYARWILKFSYLRLIHEPGDLPISKTPFYLREIGDVRMQGTSLFIQGISDYFICRKCLF
jgi:hypothetical protein